MPIWKITPSGPVQVSETKPQQTQVLDESLEDWIVNDPTLLDEPLLIIGRQVLIPGTEEHLDLLALDPQGNTVVIELKPGQVKDAVDMQALRCASYIAKWEYEDFELQAREFLDQSENSDFDFIAWYAAFCADAGVDEPPAINTDQRLIIVSSEVQPKLGSVALWLSSHGIDIKVVEVEVYTESDTLLVQPHTLVPLPMNRFMNSVHASNGHLPDPWSADGQEWHLERRCSPETKALFLKLDGLIQENFDVNGPQWNQELFVSYRIKDANWLAVGTRSRTLRLEFLAEAGFFFQTDLALRLNVTIFDENDTLLEKFGQTSSILVKKRNEATDRVILRMNANFDLANSEFLDFLTEAYEAFPR